MGLMRTSSGLKQRVEQYTAEYGPSVLTWMYNSTGSSIAVGVPVAQMFDVSATNPIGSFEGMATANLDRFAGVVYPDAIASHEWGWVLSWGYCPAATVEGTTDITTEDSLKGVNAQAYLVKDNARGTAASYKRTAYAMETFTTNATASKKVYVEAIPLNG